MHLREVFSHSQSMEHFHTALADTSKAMISLTYTTTVTTLARYLIHPETLWFRTTIVTPILTTTSRWTHRSSLTTRSMNVLSHIWCKRVKLVTRDHQAVIRSHAVSTWVSLKLRWCSLQIANVDQIALQAGAKLVLPPAGEIPQLKPVNPNRPRMPPPPGPPNGKHLWLNLHRCILTKLILQTNQYQMDSRVKAWIHWMIRMLQEFKQERR